MIMGDLPAYLEPSELGTREYWDHFYTANVSSEPSPGDELDGWFSDVNAAPKILKYLCGPQLNLDRLSTSFCDLGTGNGEMIFLLREEGHFDGRMLGVDYSVPSINLARKIAASRNKSGREEFDFAVWDIIKDDPPSAWLGNFDVVLDKGTFDAISLSDETDEQGTRESTKYRSKVEALIKTGGHLLVTSCNWTETELKRWFQGNGSRLETTGTISYPIYTFGGRTGQSISTVCFTKFTHT